MAMTLEAVLAAVERRLQPTLRRVGLMITRGVIRRVNDGTKAQTLQVSLLGDPTEEDDGGVPDGETPDDVEHVQPFGLSFVPPADAEVVALSVGGNRDYVVALGASSRAHRPTGAQAGEGGLYTLSGWKVFCDADGNVFIGADEAGGAVHAIALADRVDQRLKDIVNVIMNTAPTATNDGGLSLITAMQIALAALGWNPITGAPPQTTGSSKVKVVE